MRIYPNVIIAGFPCPITRILDFNISSCRLYPNEVNILEVNLGLILLQHCVLGDIMGINVYLYSIDTKKAHIVAK
jgi:hypothetical protein